MLELDQSRRDLVKHLVEVAFGAGRVLIHGPWGVGKTTLLFEAARAARESGLRTGYCGRTRNLGDVVAALTQIHEDAAAPDLSARRHRSSLRQACELAAGLLILDSFTARGTTLVGFLRSLRGKRLAIIAAADVDHPRDLAAARAVDVAYREIAVPPLPTRALERHLDLLSEASPVPFDVTRDARRALLRLAGGCPGVLERAWARLQQSRYWRAGSPLLDIVHTDLRLEQLAETREIRDAGRRLN